MKSRPLEQRFPQIKDVLLRPDFYDIFRSFGVEELVDRLDSLPFHVATLLSVKNIERGLMHPKCVSGLVEFLSRSPESQRRMLTEVLLCQGISERAASAVGTVPRHLFAPERFRKYSYLDTYIPFSRNSCLSSPGIVALMIELIEPSNGDGVLEIGIGSGYHALCLSEYLNHDTRILGIEVNEAFMSFGRQVTESFGRNNIEFSSARILGKNPLFLQGFDIVYAACAFEEPPNLLLQLIKQGGKIQFARRITKQEFTSEKDSAWLRQKYRLYEDYMQDIWYQQFACLVTAKKLDDSLTEIHRVYDVAFVEYQNVERIDEPETDLKTNLFAKLENSLHESK